MPFPNVHRTMPTIDSSNSYVSVGLRIASAINISSTAPPKRATTARNNYPRPPFCCAVQFNGSCDSPLHVASMFYAPALKVRPSYWCTAANARGRGWTAWLGSLRPRPRQSQPRSYFSERHFHKSRDSTQMSSSGLTNPIEPAPAPLPCRALTVTSRPSHKLIPKTLGEIHLNPGPV